MPLFPSAAWCRQLVELANADPEAQAAGQGWNWDVAFVVDADPPACPEPFAVWGRPRDGRVETFRVLDDLGEIDELDPPYLLRARYRIWKDLLQGRLDPVKALTGRQIQLRGDLAELLRRLKYRPMADRILGLMETEFAKE